MAKKQGKKLRWLRLDNAAKIYPAARRRHWSNVYRQSMTLTEDVDVEVLKSALNVTIKRFPSIAARLRSGAFWYYLHQIEKAPEIREEQSYPLVYMSNKEINECAFRVIVYGARIAVEVFHALTDGNGAMLFLKSLVAEYLEQKYSITIPYECGILDRREAPKPEELEDSFLKYAGPVAASRKDTNAWRPQGEVEPERYLHLTCFQIPVKDALERAHQYGATLTVFMGAILMQALANLQREKVPNIRRRKPVKLLIPANLRSLFPSKTLRNFVMYTIPEIDPRLGDYTIEELCKMIQHKMGLELTAKHMSTIISTNVGDEKNILLRLVPLPLKNLVMKAVFDAVGERRSCMSMSNLGRIQLPKEMQPYVKRVDFILGVQAAAPYNCGMLSYGDTIYMNFIRNTRLPDLERHFFAVLQHMGLPAMVESNTN